MEAQDPHQPSQNAPKPPSDSQSQPQTGGYQQPKPMYWTRPLDPQQMQVSAETQQKVNESHQKYPKLNLSEGEYVISDVKRHPIGLVLIWGSVGVAIVAILAALALFVSGQQDSSLSVSIPPYILGVTAFIIIFLGIIGGAIGAWVYRANRFYLTNESVIQNIQYSLFANREQTVSLGNVEDASYTKTGLVQHMFDYGSLRLSTQGDETTYRFHYATSPDKQVATLNNAVEAFKNGRPIE